MKPRPLLRVVLVSGLSGAGKASALRTLEDIGYETMDNPPLEMLESMVGEQLTRLSGRAGATEPPQGLAIGIDVRSRGFDEEEVIRAVGRLRCLLGGELDLLYITADDWALLGRYTETRRRHPLATKGGRLAEAIALERALTDRLRAAADLVIDTTGLKPADLRQMLEDKFASRTVPGLAVSIISFAFPKGLPREADMVFDVRFLRNPHYDPILRPGTGLDPEVAKFIAADPDYPAFMQKMNDFVGFLLPRFVREGKKYATIAIGCTGGRHRSVFVAESLGRELAFGDGQKPGFAVNLLHRELADDARRKNPLIFFGQEKIGHLDQSSETGDATAGIADGSPEAKL